MKEILFRGKRIDNGEWVYSSIIMQDKEHKLLSTEVELFDGKKWRAVDPETVGQDTGLTDENGKKIFEGDIVKTWKNTIGKIEFGQYWDEEIEEDFYGYAWIGKDEYGDSIILSLNKCWNGHGVIGNIYDNSELLEVNK